MHPGVIRFFIREGTAGRMSREAKPEELADFCIAAAQGAMPMGKTKRDPRTVDATIRATLAHVKQQFRATV